MFNIIFRIIGKLYLKKYFMLGCPFYDYCHSSQFLRKCFIVRSPGVTCIGLWKEGYFYQTAPTSEIKSIIVRPPGGTFTCLWEQRYYCQTPTCNLHQIPRTKVLLSDPQVWPVLDYNENKGIIVRPPVVTCPRFREQRYCYQIPRCDLC